MDQSVKNEFQRLLSFDEDELFSAFFNESQAGTGSLGTPGMRRRKGRELFEKYRSKLKGVVCDTWNGCAKVDTHADLVEFAGAVAVIIAPAIPQISAAIAAAIIVKIGVRSFCECE